MPVDGFTLQLSGMAEVRAALAGVTAKVRKQAIRKALREAAKIIQAEARAKAPILQTSAPYRRPGTIRRNIVVRASKFARKAGNEGVYVSVKPLRGAAQKTKGKAGAKNPNDPYYWWWQEFGWVASGARVRGGDSPVSNNGRGLKPSYQSIFADNGVDSPVSNNGRGLKL